MDPLEWLPLIIGAMLIQTPIYIVQIVGIGLAFANRARYPRAAALTGVALFVSVIVSLLATCTNLILPQAIMRGGGTSTNVGMAAVGTGAAFALVHAIVWGLILYVIFGRREQ
jgi:hypothetical protein